MNIGLLVVTNGRDSLLSRTVASAESRLVGQFCSRVIHDDSADPDHRVRLGEAYPDYTIIGADRTLGFGGAINNAWEYLSQLELDFVFHLEDDFLFNEDIPLDRLCAVLRAEPRVQQVALLRQPWNQEERTQGGLLRVRSHTYNDMSVDGVPIVAHRNFFTTNPSLYRHSLMRLGWPTGPSSEGVFGINLFRDPDVICSFLGTKADPPKVEHIGDYRTGVLY